MGNSIGGISRPYVGQNAQNIQQVSDKKPSDVTSPPKPAVLEAFAFELAADGSTVVPPPPPNRPGIDPLVIRLGNIEVGTRIELVSLTDNPQAEFDAKHKDEIFELPKTGYDVAAREATIALSAEQMKEKGIVAGERFLLRQVDKEGNASESVHVHLDPRNWAGGRQLDEPVQGGGTQRVIGRQIDIDVGVHGLQGNPNPGQTEQVLGKVTSDTHAPVLVESAVSVVTEKLTKGEAELLHAYTGALGTLIGGSNYTLDQIKQTLTGNQASWEPHPQYGAPFKVLKAIVDDPALFQKLADFTSAAAGGAPGRTYIDYNQAHAMASAGTTSLTMVKLDKALEPGVSIQVQNSRTGETVQTTQADDARSATLVLRDVKNGDPLILTYHDNPPGQQPNHGKPYGFRYESSAKDGKARSNPLDIRLGAFAVRPTQTQEQPSS